ncbi:hypothetical protein CNEO3_200007 [Clostridium neonatale]|nr:hypothetical protein CNEO3_170015 [Clostridium neonatale]CAI3586826.1 hypothetical protein CNEO3_10125 [Clostridium neonatale]CAI3612729.1 hypothetical protein CNEO3_200007 [Clostridium neonatale]CAI3627719.1 hypothetical protein CNEO3_280007 [Clostridium neonatale]CAI3682589.1 hypothetical protein CNEO3_90006 [Clostridium neonatale]
MYNCSKVWIDNRRADNVNEIAVFYIIVILRLVLYPNSSQVL